MKNNILQSIWSSFFWSVVLLLFAKLNILIVLIIFIVNIFVAHFIIVWLSSDRCETCNHWNIDGKYCKKKEIMKDNFKCNKRIFTFDYLRNIIFRR